MRKRYRKKRNNVFGIVLFWLFMWFTSAAAAYFVAQYVLSALGKEIPF